MKHNAAMQMVGLVHASVQDSVLSAATVMCGEHSMSLKNTAAQVSAEQMVCSHLPPFEKLAS